MIIPSYILALSNRGFVANQLHCAFGGADKRARRTSFWRGWGLPELDTSAGA